MKNKSRNVSDERVYKCQFFTFATPYLHGKVLVLQEWTPNPSPFYVVIVVLKPLLSACLDTQWGNSLDPAITVFSLHCISCLMA